MSFSARQQQCLEAMGIVPWVSKAQQVEIAPVTLADVESQATSVAAVQPVSQPASPTPLPDSLDDLKSWLPKQPVRTMQGRAGPQSYSGVEDAPLLVVVQGAENDPTPEPLRSPFTAESAQLFELMMRAIAMPVAKRKHCVLRSSATQAQSPGDGMVTGLMAQQLHIQTRAVLLLVNQWDASDVQLPDEHHVRLDESALPLWRIPHPDLLIQRPELKRQAWVSLQALQTAL